jgi:hypothetical protein
MAARLASWFGLLESEIFRLFLPSFFTFTIGVAAAFASQTAEYGFFDAPEFVSSTGTSYSDLQQLVTTDGGAIYGFGYSTRYNGEFIPVGRAAWIVNSGLGNSSVIRVGLTGEEFVKTYDSSQASTVLGMNAAGQFYGSSTEYHEGSGSVGVALWIATVTDPAAQRIGLYATNEFSSNAGNHNSQVENTFTLSASGYLAGYSTRYNNSPFTRGQGAWVANAATGETFRIGLYEGNEFTSSDGSQNTVLRTDSLGQQAWNNWGVLMGSSDGQSATAALWVAGIATGATARLGLHDQLYADTVSGSIIMPDIYTAGNGANVTQLTGHTENGILWGNTFIYNGGDTATGQTAWLFDTQSFTQTEFRLSVSAGLNSFSVINGITDHGLAFGRFTACQDLALDTALSSDRAFLWSNSLGAQIMDFSLMDNSNPLHEFMALQDCAFLTDITNITGSMSDLDNLAIFGTGYDLLGNLRQFELQLIPEPSTWALLLLTLPLLLAWRVRFASKKHPNLKQK